MSTPRVNLGRIESIVNKVKQGEGSWAIVSPMRGEATPEANQAATVQIQKDIRGMGLGYRPCDGVGQEEGGAQNREKSFFVPKITLDQATELWHKYNQYAILYGGPETKGEVTLMADGETTNLGSFSRGKEEGDQYWTEVKKQPFVFK
jgi:hypothetical protein